MVLSFESKKLAIRPLIRPLAIFLIIMIGAWLIQGFIQDKVLGFCQAYRGKLHGQGLLYARIASYPIWLIALPFLIGQFKKFKRLARVMGSQIMTLDTDQSFIEHWQKDGLGKISHARLPFDRLIDITANVRENWLSKQFDYGTLELALELETEGLALPYKINLPMVKDAGLISRRIANLQPVPILHKEKLQKETFRRVRRDNYSTNDLKKSSYYGIPVDQLKYAGVS